MILFSKRSAILMEKIGRQKGQAKNVNLLLTHS